MQDDRHFKIDDLDEREATLALRDMFSSISTIGSSSDPIGIVCNSLVRCVSEIKFAFYCYANEETGHIAAAKNGVSPHLPSPDVQRKVVTNIRDQTRDGNVAVLAPEHAQSLIPKSDRKRWRCHLGLAIRVSDGERQDAAVLAVFVRPDFVVFRRHLELMALYGDVATAFLSRQKLMLHIGSCLDAARRTNKALGFRLEAIRSKIREFVFLTDNLKCDHIGKISKLTDLLRDLHRKEITSCTETSGCVDSLEFEDASLRLWIEKGMDDPRVKAIVGVRGSSKTRILNAIRSYIISSGVSESQVVILDFEDSRFRRFKTESDVVGYLEQFPTSQQNYLFLDEIGMVGWHAELLDRLQNLKGWSIWLTASTAHAIGTKSEKSRKDIMLYRVWPDSRVPRSHIELERSWCQIFMRDVVSGNLHTDIRAIEALAEYYSDHLAEVKSLQDISTGLKFSGRAISRTSVSTYRQALIDAYLIEVSEIYDVFEKSVVKSISGRVFYTDLELRKWRYGDSPENDATRTALNRFYLSLRKKYAKVYTPRDNDADFVTIDVGGKIRLWHMVKDADYTQNRLGGWRQDDKGELK